MLLDSIFGLSLIILLVDFFSFLWKIGVLFKVISKADYLNLLDNSWLLKQDNKKSGSYI